MNAVLQELTYDSLREGAVWPFDRRYIRPPHFHGQLECLLVRRGHAVLHLGTHAMQVQEGRLCWILPGVPHVMSDFSTDFDMWVVQLDTVLVERSWAAVDGSVAASDGGGPFETWSVALGEHLAGRPIVPIGGEEARRLDELATSVWAATCPADARAGLAAFGDLALKASLANVDRRRPSSVGELAACLLLAAPTLDRGAVAAALGVSEGFLSRTVHRDLGVTFVEHRARARVAHFLALAQGRGRNFLDAALAAGFGSYSQFHRTFTRLAGSGPSDYLAQGRRRAQLLVAGDARCPDSGTMSQLAEHERQRAPL